MGGVQNTKIILTMSEKRKKIIIEVRFCSYTHTIVGWKVVYKYYYNYLEKYMFRYKKKVLSAVHRKIYLIIKIENIVFVIFLSAEQWKKIKCS